MNTWPLPWRSDACTSDAVRASAVWRTALLVAAAAGIVAAITLGEPSAVLLRDPPLALLLRGMAAIKAVVCVAAAVAVFWRFGHPVDRSVAIAYGLGLSVLAGASLSIWLLSRVAFAALAFHAAAFVVLGTAWRDDRCVKWRPGRAR